MKNFDKLNKVTQKAALTASAPVSSTKPKSLRAVPVAYIERHKKLKSSGKTSLDFSAFIIEALREKLEKEES